MNLPRPRRSLPTGSSATSVVLRPKKRPEKCRMIIPIQKSLYMRFLVFLCAFFHVAFAQTQPPVAQNFHQWGSVTIFNGLPSDSVRAIAQTPDGILWFGTDNGLARFDGRRVQTVSLPDTTSNKILALKLAADG